MDRLLQEKRTECILELSILRDKQENVLLLIFRPYGTKALNF